MLKLLKYIAKSILFVLAAASSLISLCFAFGHLVKGEWIAGTAFVLLLGVFMGVLGWFIDTYL